MLGNKQGDMDRQLLGELLGFAEGYRLGLVDGIALRSAEGDVLGEAEGWWVVTWRTVRAPTS